MSRHRPGRLAALTLLLGLAITAPAAAQDPVAPEDASLAGLAARIASSVRSQATQALDTVAMASANPCSGSGDLRTTSNGSFTVLLMGSDYRKSPYIGERTDTLIVVNVARNGRTSMVAIPRDTIQVPLAGGGTSGSRRVNALYIGYKRSSVGRHQVDCQALDHVRRDIAKALETSIPYYAMIRMDQFQQLIGEVGGFRMRVRDTLIDYSHRGTRSIYVPATSSYPFAGGGPCGRRPVKCHNALLYVRSRKGTEGGGSNTDYRRLRRQQSVVFAVAKRVVDRGRGSDLTDLLQAAKGRVYTNLPKTAGGMLDLYVVAKEARFDRDDGKVFGPTRWASYVGTYTYRLRLADVRRWVDHHFRP